MSGILEDVITIKVNQIKLGQLIDTARQMAEDEEGYNSDPKYVSWLRECADHVEAAIKEGKNG